VEDDEDEDDDRGRSRYRDREEDDDRDEDEEEERPRRRKKKRRKKSSAAPWLLGIAGGLLGIGAIIGLIFLIRGLGGDSTLSKHQKAAKELVRLMTDLVEALNSVRDRETAKSAAVRINKICDDVEALAERGKKLPKLSNSDDEKLRKEFMPQFQRVTQQLQQAGFNAGRASQGEPAMLQAAQRLIQMGHKLKDMGN
jgi:hypothetical protein